EAGGSAAALAEEVQGSPILGRAEELDLVESDIWHHLPDHVDVRRHSRLALNDRRPENRILPNDIRVEEVENFVGIMRIPRRVPAGTEVAENVIAQRRCSGACHGSPHSWWAVGTVRRAVTV